MKKLKKATALDLEIKGSMGTFAVGGTGAKSSVRVQYIQTYVRFTLKGDHEEKLLGRLAPVREVFPVKDLDFEQIMQRDIDDARVATELVPYLLEESKAGLVKLFPPIIVVVLPVNEAKLPAEYYPEVQELEEEDEENAGTKFRVVRSGPVGAEVFEFRQVVEDGERWDHDYARLRLNTSRSALVIVDGQHRAMGLIALYRNCTKWPDNARGVEPYYRLWSKQILDKYDLSEVKLPVMFCVFPELDGRSTEDMKVYNACRAVFLALNKNARRVTRARNYLLDDRDIVSSFMRSILTDIKDLSDPSSSSTLRLWNVELDADEDRTVLTTTTAITGVTHLFGLIERLTLRAAPGTGLTATRLLGQKQTKLELCFKRLQLTNEISKAVRDDTRRDTCDPKTEAILVAAFRQRVGKYIVRGLSEFGPYRANNIAALYVHTRLSTGATAEFYRTILFEGQSMDQVFRGFVDGLKKELKEPGRVTSPELKQVKKEFDDRERELAVQIAELQKQRLDNMLERCPKEVQTNASVRTALRELYDDTFTTAAFQTGLFVTFFAAIDEENEARSKPPAILKPMTSDEVDAEFGRYMEHVNAFFVVSSLERLRRLLAVLYGRVVEEGDGSIRVEKWAETLRAILIPGELKPDEWSKFRMMFAELWTPSHADLKKRVVGLRDHLRKQAIQSYHDRTRRERAYSLGIAVDHLDEGARLELRDSCVAHFSYGLGQLLNLTDAQIVKLTPQLREYLEKPEEAPDPSK